MILVYFLNQNIQIVTLKYLKPRMFCVFQLEVFFVQILNELCAFRALLYQRPNFFLASEMQIETLTSHLYANSILTGIQVAIK